MVYAAGFHSGNQHDDCGSAVRAMPFEAPVAALHATSKAVRQPHVGLIVKWNGSHWVDELGPRLGCASQLRLPDKDVFAIDAMAPYPPPVAGASGVYSGVGTMLYNMAVNPVSGRSTSPTPMRSINGASKDPGRSPARQCAGTINENRITVLDGDGRPAAAPEQAHRLLVVLRARSQTRRTR